jgi:hypothetical protein
MMPTFTLIVVHGPDQPFQDRLSHSIFDGNPISMNTDQIR